MNIVWHNWFENARDNKLSCFLFICDFRNVYYNTFYKESTRKPYHTDNCKGYERGFIYVLKQSFILKSMLLAALLNLILTPLFVVGAPIIIRVTMESSHTLYGIGMGLIDFATIIGALSIGFFAKSYRCKHCIIG